MDKTKEILLSVLTGFVDYPTDVAIKIAEDKDEKGSLTIINVKVRPEDIGVCIGDRGATAEALRRIVGLIGYKQSGDRVQLKIDAPKLPKNYFY